MKQARWSRLKEENPRHALAMEYAVVKEFEDGSILIEKSRLDFVLDDRQIMEKGV